MAVIAHLIMPSAHALTAITNSNIGAAVTAWVTDPTTATTTYGDVAGWNIASVTSMASLFWSKPTFNADISKWNVASVVDMYQVCAPRLSLCGMFVYVCTYRCHYLNIYLH